MQVRLVEIIRPSRHEVSQIDDKGSVDRRDIDPFAGDIAHLQAAEIILRKQREAAVIGVRRKAPPGLF